MSQTNKKGLLLLKVVIGFLLLLLLLIGGAWIWSGSNGSLKQGIGIAQRFLKSGQTLTVSDVDGSLRHGGRIGSLTWQQDDLYIELTSVDWRLNSLSFSAVEVESAAINRVQVIPVLVSKQIDAAAPAVSIGASKKIPPKEIILPIHLNVKCLQVHEVIVGKDKNNIVASNIDLSYKFDGQSHNLKLASLHAADGDYQGGVTLQTPSLKVDGSMTGKLTAAIPESTQKVSIDADAKVSGVLTALNVKANAQASADPKNVSRGTKLQLQAVVRPWEALMLPQANLTLQAFNAQAFVAQAPQTLLSGTAVVKTTQQAASGEQVSHIVLDMKNAASGVLDASKVPVTALDAKLRLQGNLLTIDQFNAFIGQGKVQATGNYRLPVEGTSGAIGAWKANAVLTNVDPHLVYSQVASDKISGTITASQGNDNKSAIGFDMELNAARGSNVEYFRVKNVTTQGQFVTGDHIQLATLTVQATNGRVEGNNVRYTLKGQAVSGPFKLSAPGVQAQVTLNNFAALSGTAQISLSVNGANEAIKWLGALPVNLSSLLPFLNQAAIYVQDIAHYTHDMPIMIQGGWKSPHVTLQINAKEIIAKIVADKAGGKLQGGLGSLLQDKLGQGGKGSSSSSKEAADKLLRNIFK